MDKRRHILVVDDDPLVAEVIAAALEELYETSHVATSAAALDLLSSLTADLMLLDCTLPDGVDPDLVPAANQAHVPVLFMSGDRERMERLTSEPRPFILKPFTLKDLLAAVEREIG